MGKNVPAADSIEAIDVGIMEIKTAVFYKTEGGFTGLKYNGNDYKHIVLRRALPIAAPLEYISVADKDNKEIGIIRSVADMAKDQFSIVVDELNKRYYCPEVKEIKSIKDKLGYVYMEILIDSPDKKDFVKNCAVKDVNKNIRMLDENRLIIFDVDGNRYIINSLSALDNKSVKRLEPYLF